MSEAIGDGKRFGRTWPDVLERSFFLLVGAGVLLALIFFGGSLWGAVPVWVWVAALMSVLFVPFLVARAKEGARLVLITDGPLTLTEYRVGRRYPMRIEGEPLYFSSTAGTSRMLLTAFDPETGDADGTALEGATAFDLARDVGTFRRVADSFAAHLRGERLTNEMVGVEVERRVSEYSDAWLRLLYGSLDLSELESLIGGDDPLDGPIDASLAVDAAPEVIFDE